MKRRRTHLGIFDLLVTVGLAALLVGQNAGLSARSYQFVQSSSAAADPSSPTPPNTVAFSLTDRVAQLNPKIHQLTPEQVADFCEHSGQGPTGSKGATVVPPRDAFSLRCLDANSNPVKFSETSSYRFVDHICTYAYARLLGTDTISRLQDAGNPYGWGCLKTISNAGGISERNLRAWCESPPRSLQLYFWDGATYPAYGWFCTDAKHSRFEGVPMDQVCAATYPRHEVIDIVGDVKDKNSWSCSYI